MRFSRILLVEEGGERVWANARALVLYSKRKVSRVGHLRGVSGETEKPSMTNNFVTFC